MTGVSPTLARRMLVAAVQRLHTESGLTAETVARRVGVDATTLGRWLSGKKQTLRVRDVRDLCAAYGTDPSTTDELVRLAETAHQRGITATKRDWFADYQFDVYLTLERDATTIDTYAASLIPGLLQTEEYATAVIRASVPDADDTRVREELTIRMDRQATLWRPERPTRLLVILDEAALWRTLPDATMARQLVRLRAAAERENITVRILPTAAHPHPAIGFGPFTILSSDGVPAVVYEETPVDARYRERPHEVERYRAVLTRLGEVALPATATVGMIDAALAAVTGGT